MFAVGLFATTEELQSGTITFGHSAGLRCELSESLMLLELVEQQTQAGPSYTTDIFFCKTQSTSPNIANRAKCSCLF